MTDIDLTGLRERADNYRSAPESTAEIFYAADVRALLDALAARDAVIAAAAKAANGPYRFTHEAETRLIATRAALAQSPATALDAVKAEAWDECTRQFIALNPGLIVEYHTTPTEES